MTRHRVDRARLIAGCLVVAVIVALSSAASASDGRRTRVKLSRYDRRGAELGGEVPRFLIPIGKGYEGEYGIGDGWGFGFRALFVLTDVIGLEGRIVQTNHHVSSTDSNWDLDQYLVGGRYMFRGERALQPFVAAGGTRLALEFDEGENQTTDFIRLSGYGAYVSAGVDYILSQRWVAGARVDYIWMNYSHLNEGLAESDLEHTLNGSALGFSLSLSYRVPILW
jgi:opacity protein-like surface antigen